MKRRNFLKNAAVTGPVLSLFAPDLAAVSGFSAEGEPENRPLQRSGRIITLNGSGYNEFRNTIHADSSNIQVHCALIQYGDLQAIVGDCSRNGAGGMKYCGLWSLTSKYRVFNCFGNSYAGLLPGELRGRENVTLELIDDRSAALYKPATAKDPTEARATYRLVSSNEIEHTLTFRDNHSRISESLGYLEVSWCSYMNSPEDIRLNFLSGGQMKAYISPQHGVGSRIAPSYIPEDQIEKTPPQDEKHQPFHVNWAGLRFDAPFYFGRLGQMVLLYVFDNPNNLRFFCSPTGGGGSLLPGKSCPAWDFLWIVPAESYQVGREYSFRVRLIYKPYVSDEDIREEVNRIGKEWEAK